MKPQLVSKSIISYTKKKMNFISYNNNKNKSLINKFAIGLLIIVSIFLYFRYKNRHKIKQDKNKQLKNFIKEIQKVELELQEKKNNHLIRTFNEQNYQNNLKKKNNDPIKQSNLKNINIIRSNEIFNEYKINNYKPTNPYFVEINKPLYYQKKKNNYSDLLIRPI